MLMRNYIIPYGMITRKMESLLTYNFPFSLLIHGSIHVEVALTLTRPVSSKVRHSFTQGKDSYRIHVTATMRHNGAWI